MNSPEMIEDLARVRASSMAASREKPIGALLLDAGLISLTDVDRILGEARTKGMRFGDTAVSLGLLKVGDLHGALAYQFDYPVLPVGGSSVSREVIAAYEADNPVLDDLRSLRNQLLLRRIAVEGMKNRLIAVMSPGRKEGKTFIAANLAVTFSQMGQRTLLLDADLRQGRLHEVFGISNQFGVSALLAGRRPEAALNRIDGLRDLSVVPKGAEPPNPYDLLSRESFTELLEQFACSYDVVILDTPAATTSPEAQAIATKVEGVVVVARRGRTHTDALVDLAGAVRAAGAKLVGTVLSQF